MSNKYASIDNLRFLWKDVHQSEKLFKHERYQDYDVESIDLLLNAAKDLCDKELHPYVQIMDEDPARYEDGKIIVHPQVEKVIALAAENGWIGAEFEYDRGGMQLPHIICTSLNYIAQAANNQVTGYLALTGGAAGLINSFGSQELFDTYVPNMLAGKWMGSMALTEPQAGSSLSDITTSATPTAEGYYHIKGQKIFISGGDHEYAENFVHLTLARIEGAPAGTKGISLFVVPKHRPDSKGSLTPNDVITAGDFQKMGQRGYCTTHLSYGENDDCRGWLVGEPNRGLKYMFQMMNGARIEVGMTGVSIASAAYYASLQYAKERPQGRAISNSGKKNVQQEQTLIINHPDVRRMLLLQKAVVEGGLSLLLEASKYNDLQEVLTGEEKENAQLLLEILTPIAKTYPSEMGQVAISNGLQVLGGYGFCTDFPLQQYYRDVRITAIYEGTTGIQSLDLLGRKVTMQNGKAIRLLMQEIGKSIQAATQHKTLEPYALRLGEKLVVTQKVLEHLLGFAMKGNHQRFLADASIFMEFFSTIVVAWQLLKQAVVAQEALTSGKMNYAPDFYESKILTTRFYFKYELTKTEGLAQTLMDEEQLTLVGDKELIM